MSFASAIQSAYNRVVGRVEPMRRSTSPADDSWWGGFGSQSATGVHVSQYTAMACTAVMACVRMLAMDLAKADISLVRQISKQQREEATDHVLYDLLEEPNDWQTGLEFRAQMQFGLILRGNAYAVIVRDWRGNPLYFVPINPDFCRLYEAPDGSLFYLVTRVGLHQMAVLRDQPLLVPARDILHLKTMSTNGLVGLSPLDIAREAIGLGIAQEQQAARWIGNGAALSGYLSTTQKLTDESAKRSKESWNEAKAGLINTGKTAVLEQGLTWTPLTLKSQDLEFIGSRRLQIEEIGRIFRVPFPMISEVGSSARVDPDVLAQHYVNYTMSDYTRIWASGFSKKFGLRAQQLRLSFDMSVLLEADLASRVNTHRLAVLGGLESQNEGRIGIGLDPKPDPAYEILLTPSNSTPYGSDHSGNAPDGAGRPEKNGGGNADQPNAST